MDGIWIVYFYDTSPVVHSVHPNEFLALRTMNDLGYGSVKFWHFGTVWSD